ncbi:unnamed protein product [Kuraishia capsulata CBS 1993]|uniref:SAP domain-containing protein n=1 Tax=Kuraishia capsulata CBS 1993 TaxID=1382522 RepID=W6MG26_9ASCO|nr:uncharacterized protein KUCA_T00000622001 [Kuraishia capsulata CBS 1993]CDK24656.1 unnamed protein product [Kuraishia capsulata CBS 1993]
MASVLRSARSLPTLRTAYQQGVRQQLQSAPRLPPSASSSKYFSNKAIKTVFAEDDLSFVSRQYETFQRQSQPITFVRSVHQTSKAQTTLLDSNAGSKYVSMNLQGLKSECKRRGLKVSGRKLELIQRLSHSDAPGSPPSSRQLSTASKSKTVNAKEPENLIKIQKKSLSTKTVQKRTISRTATVSAKGDSSTIESFKIPHHNYDPPDPVPPIKIPSLSTEASLKDATTPVDPKNPKDILDAKVEGAVSLGVDSPPVATQSGVVVEPLEIDTSESSQSGEEPISFRDKGILAAFAVASIGWWYLKPKTSEGH